MTSAAIMAGGSRRRAATAWPRKMPVALLVVLWSGVCTAAILNPSFETTYTGLPWPRTLPQSWGHVDHPSFNSYCTNLWSTDGTRSAVLFNLIGRSVSVGSYQSFYQYVDLTGIGSIEFDVSLTSYPAAVFEHFEAELLVDNKVLWREAAGGVHRDQQVDVAALPGWRRLEIRITALDSGVFGVAYWSEWDNLRLRQGPTTIPATIDLDPNTLNPNSNGNWLTCHIKLSGGYDVGNIDGATVTLNDLPAYMSKQGWATALVNGDNVADFDADGVLERMVKFERAAVQAVVHYPEATVTVKGRLIGGTPFEGHATLRVLAGDSPKQP